MDCSPVFFKSNNGWKSFCLNCLNHCNILTPIQNRCNMQEQKPIQLCNLSPVSIAIGDNYLTVYRCNICKQLSKIRSAIYCLGYNSLYVGCQTCLDGVSYKGVHPCLHYKTRQVIKPDSSCLFHANTCIHCNITLSDYMINFLNIHNINLTCRINSRYTDIYDLSNEKYTAVLEQILETGNVFF